jgi:hypothetical protein
MYHKLVPKSRPPVLRVWQVIAGGWERQVFIWEDEEDRCVSNHRTLEAHKCAAQETPSLSALHVAHTCLPARQLPVRQSFTLSRGSGMTSCAWLSYTRNTDAVCWRQATTQVILPTRIPAATTRACVNIMSSSSAGRITIWNLQSGERRATLQHEAPEFEAAVEQLTWLAATAARSHLVAYKGSSSPGTLPAKICLPRQGSHAHSLTNSTLIRPNTVRGGGSNLLQRSTCSGRSCMHWGPRRPHAQGMSPGHGLGRPGC